MGNVAKKPIYGLVLSLVGGITMIVSVALLLLNISDMPYRLFPDSRINEILGLVLGILTVRFGFQGYVGNGKTWGIVVLIFGIINLIAGADVYFIGSILAILGGVLLRTGK